MPVQEQDISWQVLRRIVADWAGAAAELAEVKPLVGGCINTTLLLSTKDGGKVVLKISPHRVNLDLQREAEQLKMLHELGLPVPRVYACHTATLDYPHSYLLMEYIEGIDLAAARHRLSPVEFDDLQRDLAEVVLKIHSHTDAEYHRLSSTDGNKFSSWPAFYREVYDAIWRDVAKSPLLPPKANRQIGKIHDKLDHLLAHDDCPRLVHWDIWSTNILFRANGDGKWGVAALLDPNCKYAHAEAEIAYMDLFHTITPAFLKHYQEQRKLADDYHLRKPIYQLYPLINHVHLFGQEYVRPLLARWKRWPR